VTTGNSGKINGDTLHKESLITVISTLKHFPEETVFSILNSYFYNPDIDISIEAIRSAASASNGLAIPHLFTIIENGTNPQKIEAIRALSKINMSHLVTNLIKYFSVFNDSELRYELIKAVNELSPGNNQVAELNYGLLLDKDQDEILTKEAVHYPIRVGNFSFLTHYLPHASSSIQHEALINILKTNNTEISAFLKRLPLDINNLSETTLGIYLCAYVLKTSDPKGSYIRNIIQHAKKETILSFLGTLKKELGELSSLTLKGVLKILLSIPYLDREVESVTGDLIKQLIDIAKNRSSRIRDDFSMTTSGYLDALFKRVKENHISLKGAKEKEKFLHLLLAHLLESHISPLLVIEIQDFFKNKSANDVNLIIDNIKSFMENGDDEDKRRFKACLPLFLETDRKTRLQIYSILKNVDPEIPLLLKRINRFVRIIGWLEAKAFSKKICDVLNFSREEKFSSLELTCIITLCQLKTKDIINEVKLFLESPPESKELVHGYLKGAGFLPPESVAEPLLRIFFSPSQDTETRFLILETLRNMDLSRTKYVLSELLRVFEVNNNASLKEKAGEIISIYGDFSLFHRLIDFAQGSDAHTRIICITALREISKRNKKIPMDVLIHHLYLFLERGETLVQVEALFTLFELGDDYAVEILKEWLDSNDEYLLPQVLHRLRENLPKKLLPHTMRLITSEKMPVQRELRNILPGLCRSRYSDEVKKTLIEYLGAFRESVSTNSYTVEKHFPTEREGIIQHPKIEFKFKKEHSQILTVIFIDIVEYTKRSSNVDMSSLMKMVKTFEDIVIPTVEFYNGRIIKKMGDGVLATFKHPVNASVSALEIQDKVNDYNNYAVKDKKFLVRIGLHKGSVILKGNDIYGEVVNIASRIENAAPPGNILVTESIYHEIKEYVTCVKFGEINVKGIDKMMVAYSPTEITGNLRDILTLRQSNYEAFLSVDKGSVFEKLKEALFSPTFQLPGGHSSEDGTLVRAKELFVDISKAVENIAHDPHEEYVFKRYLQDKWDEFV